MTEYAEMAAILALAIVAFRQHRSLTRLRKAATSARTASNVHDASQDQDIVQLGREVARTRSSLAAFMTKQRKFNSDYDLTRKVVRHLAIRHRLLRK